MAHVVISPAGGTALSSAFDSTLILWDLASGAPIRRFPVTESYADHGVTLHGAPVAIHPDGRTAIAGEPDGTVLKWQLAEPSPSELVAWIGEKRALRELTCQELAEFLHEYVDETLDPERRKVFERHLGLCPPCIEFLESYKKTIELCGDACGPCEEEVPEVPEQIVKAILAARAKEK